MSVKHVVVEYNDYSGPFLFTLFLNFIFIPFFIAAIVFFRALGLFDDFFVMFLLVQHSAVAYVFYVGKYIRVNRYYVPFVNYRVEHEIIKGATK